MKSYGIDKSDSKNKFEQNMEEFSSLGYSIIENAVPENELEILRKELDRIYLLQEESFGKDNLKKINEEYMARALLCYSEAYLNIAQNRELLKYVERALGNYYILLLQNGIINMPNEEHHQSSWHRDFPYQNWVSSEPLGCNLYFCLDDFNEETGSICFLPHSHKMSHVPSAEYFQKNSVQVIAEPGSVILFDSMLYHKAGYNSSGKIRRGINNMYGKAIARQQVNLPEMLKGKYAADPFLNILLGYDAQTPSTVEELRNRRLKKNQKSY